MFAPAGEPHRPALVAGAATLTYADLTARVAAVATGLAAAGVAPGDRVAVFSPNRPEQVVTYLACLRMGAVLVPLNARYLAPEVSYAIRMVGATALVAHATRADRLAGLDLDALGLRRRWVIEGEREGWTPFPDLLATAAAGAAHDGDPADPALVLFTSGTTSKPKGVTHSRASLAWTVRTQARVQGLDAGDVNLTSLSISHIAGLTGQVLPTLATGGCVLLLDGPDAGQIIDAIVRHRATRLQMLPATLADIVGHPGAGDADLSSLRACIAGGDKVPVAVQDRFLALAGLEATEVCGMTECFNYAMNPVFGAKRRGSIGLPCEGDEIHPSEPGATGQILVRSPGTMAGYWGRPDLTADALQDGWLHTGDIGRRDADGWLWFVGRAKEIIIRAGSNVSPQEVEGALTAHPGVAEAGVCGVPDERLGERVAAFVRPEPGAALDPDGLLRFAAARLAAYMVPEHLWVVDDLPRNPTGKVDRHALTARAEALLGTS
ncbi:MAG: AMP-binding protein [Thermoleophilia bacterium]|jgi:acyl-CoA synthetase (AMP-forming)/AMP-acid ligase II|nr:AMP-binding protein [Thermoleophilia bacterium]